LDAMGKLNCFSLLGLVVMLCLLPSCAVRHGQSLTVLDRVVTMQVYGAEILESVINRLCVDSMQDIKFDTMMLLPYRAKARDYKEVTVRKILDDQLEGTPIKYRLSNNGLILYNAETGDYSTNSLSGIKR